MRYLSYIIWILCCVFLITACSSENQDKVNNSFSQDKVLQGTIIEFSEKGFTLKLTGESKKVAKTIRVGLGGECSLNGLQEGQQIKVWYDYIRESNPPQTRALKVEGEAGN
ncbi:DUF3221 domain-containing protein [Rossellomorea vietnamensis]|uniref:DUF3221 domain-containing protein n=1 Tax=Rossellomorea vietnamensis TaxID=218284 RepID=A0A5D4ME04_9BACI|nr:MULTISPECIES: DUF3221 domain-containing protein [Bacillaceae]TYR99220.1 DUF3221 domain-containing protein [Rossellomorea vietnamensis]